MPAELAASGEQAAQLLPMGAFIDAVIERKLEAHLRSVRDWTFPLADAPALAPTQ